MILDESSGVTHRGVWDLLIVLKWENSSLFFLMRKVLAASSSDTPSYPHPSGKPKGISYSFLYWKWGVLPAVTGLFDTCLLCVSVASGDNLHRGSVSPSLSLVVLGARLEKAMTTASCSEWELGLDCTFRVLLPLYHFEGILKASPPSTDENLSCSSGIEVHCFHVKKWDLVLLMGKIKLCVCVWTNLQGGWGKYDRGD